MTHPWSQSSRPRTPLLSLWALRPSRKRGLPRASANPDRYSSFVNPHPGYHPQRRVTTGRLCLVGPVRENSRNADTRVDLRRARTTLLRLQAPSSSAKKADQLACEAKSRGRPDWRGCLSEVESHALPQASAATSTDEHIEGENWGITVERKSGANYGVSHYHTELTIGVPEPGRGPKLQDMVNALAATARRDAALAKN